MAIAVPDTLDVEVLAEQASLLDRLAEQKRAEARELSKQAIDLRLQIGRQQREPLRFLQPRVAPERDARLLARVGDALREIGPCTSGALAEHLNVSQQRVYKALTELERTKAVKRSGIRRGTIWGLADDEDLSGHGAHASAYTLVLGAGQKLGTFTLDDLDDELPMLTRNAVGRAVRELVAEGKFSDEKVGRRKVFAFERPEHAPAPRPKHEPPEAKVVELARKTPLRARGAVVAGTGKRMQSGSPIVNELLREVNDWPIVEVTKHAHSFRFKIDGRTVASCSTSPGASGLAKTRAQLRAAGIDV